MENGKEFLEIWKTIGKKKKTWERKKKEERERKEKEKRKDLKEFEREGETKL